MVWTCDEGKSGRWIYRRKTGRPEEGQKRGRRTALAREVTRRKGNSRKRKVGTPTEDWIKLKK